MKVETNVVAGGRDLALVITTEHGGCTAQSGIHRQTHARRQGGVRFVSQGSVAELAHLAHGMSEKCAAAAVPVDGMKAMIICPDGVPTSLHARAELLKAHIVQAIQVDAGMIFGPDMGCPEAVLDLVAEDRKLINNITGLSRDRGGLDIDQNGLTAFGMFEAIRRFTPIPHASCVTIQGFGNVGAPLAKLLHDAGHRVVAVSNIGGIVSESTGLDIDLLFDLWRKKGDDALQAYAEKRPGRFNSDPSTLFSISADVFVPAARTSILGRAAECDGLRSENPDVLPIEDFIGSSGVKVIAEAANHPLSFEAERYAEGRGVIVLPDVIVNCGGMIGCWYEYEHRQALLEDVGAYDSALAACRALIAQRVNENLSYLGNGAGAAAKLRIDAINKQTRSPPELTHPR